MDSEYKTSQVEAIVREMARAQASISEKFNLTMEYIFSSDRESYKVSIKGYPDTEKTINIHDWSNSPTDIANQYIAVAETKYNQVNGFSTAISPAEEDAVPVGSAAQSQVPVGSAASPTPSIESYLTSILEEATRHNIKAFIALYYDEDSKKFCVRFQYEDLDNKNHTVVSSDQPDHVTTKDASFLDALQGADHILDEIVEHKARKRREAEIEAQIEALQQELFSLQQ